MRDVITELVHLLFALPIYLVALFAGSAVLAWRRGRGTRLYRYRFILMSLAAISLAFGTPVLPNAFVKLVERIEAAPTEAKLRAWVREGDAQIVVLSGGWFRRTESGFEVEMGANSWERTWAGVQLWRRIGGTLIFSGAPLPDGSDSVAAHMATVARQLGVPDEHIRIESRSKNTFENLLYTKQKFGLGPAHPIVLLTSALHLPRSVAVARKMGIEVLPYPCDYRSEGRLHWRMWLPTNDAYGAFEEVLHEWIGLLSYRVRGWA